MGMTAQPSEKAAVVATIDPADTPNGAATRDSDYIDLSKFGEVLFVFMTGTIDSTVDCSVREAQDASGTGEQELKSATQLAATKDNKQVVINVKAEQLSPGYTHVRGRIAIAAGGTGTNGNAMVALAMSPRYGPASDDDVADVDEIVT
ncbi:MAG: hypothetical protein KatS3mg105_1252 [Gemmatales bacterium]|nr:MAG: hypothetical protein KatS3mg105_1252 [Gemmatales bacterium]